MKLAEITEWLDATLEVGAFDDVSNNGVQIARRGDEVKTVAFAVDASARAVRAAADARAELLVAHHGISWGGGIRRLTGGLYNVIRAAMDANLALYACHLPLDAHGTLGNNAQLAKLLGLRKVRKAFSYHGNVIGVVGECAREHRMTIGGREYAIPRGRIGVCSGGAGEFAAAAKAMGCALYLTGEADWGNVIDAENCGMKMVCAGHYDTEVFGVRAVADAMAKALKIRTIDLTEQLRTEGRIDEIQQ